MILLMNGGALAQPSRRERCIFTLSVLRNCGVGTHQQAQGKTSLRLAQVVVGGGDR